MSIDIFMASLDAAQATQAYLDQISPEARLKSDQYMEGGYWLILWNFLLAIFIYWGLLRTRFTAALRNKIVSKFPKWATIPAFLMVYILVVSLLKFPMSIYQNFVREKKYGLLNLDFSAWMSEQFIGLVLSLFIGVLFIWGMYKIIGTFKTTWPWIVTVSTTLVAAFLLMITPVFLAPIFNTFTPMQDGPLKTDLIAMAEAAGVPADDIYVYNASKQSDRVTAYVSGFAGTTRIALADTLLTRSTPEEVRSVMGHEIGHYVLGHGMDMLINLTLIIGIGAFFVKFGFAYIAKRYGHKWGIDGIDDIAGLPLVSALIVTYFLLMTPIFNTIIRTNETEADLYGFALAQEPDGFAKTSLKLSEYRKMDPGHWEEIIFFDHPAGKKRIFSAMRYKAAMEKYRTQNPE